MRPAERFVVILTLVALDVLMVFALAATTYVENCEGSSFWPCNATLRTTIAIACVVIPVLIAVLMARWQGSGSNDGR